MNELTASTGSATAEFAFADTVKRHYWLRDDFDHLMELLPAGHREQGDWAGSSLSYPKTTKGACRELRLRGLDASVPVLNYLIKQGTVAPERTGRNYHWHRSNIDLVAEELNAQEIWTAQTYFCRAANLNFGQCVKAFCVAAARFGLEFSPTVNPAELVVIIEPGPVPMDYATIRFLPAGTPLQVAEAAREAS